MNPNKRTPRQETYLRMALRLWGDMMDGAAGDKATANKELNRLLKLAKATLDDL